MLPNFLVIGTYRAGTTWIHHALGRHPDIFLPAEKELMFFSHHYVKGLSWYEQFFQAWSGQPWVGEVCPTYLASPAAPERIKRHLPEAKLVASLRRPAQQLFSRYNLRRARRGSKESFLEVLSDHPKFMDDALYHKHLSRYVDLFGRERLLILLYDDLAVNPQDYLGKICNFLGVASLRSGAVEPPRNASQNPRSRAVEAAVAHTAKLMRRKGWLMMKASLARTGLPQAIKRLNTGGAVSQPVPAEALGLIAERTAADRARLAELVGRNLDEWI